jgi:polysaccharide biosynthesis protein PslH
VKILFVVPYCPNRIRTRPYNLIRGLVRAGHELTVATLWSSDREREECDRLLAGSARILAGKISVYRSFWNCLCALPGHAPLQSEYSWDPAFASQLADLLNEESFDAVHVEHLRGARYGLLVQYQLKQQQKAVPVVWDSVDCISGLFEQAARESSSLSSRLMTTLELSRTRPYEGWLLGQFNRVLVTSNPDRDALLNLFEEHKNPEAIGKSDDIQRRVEVLPNGVDLDYFLPGNGLREPATLVITGKMSYHANVAAVLGFVKDVMPRIWATLPEVHLWIVGKDPSRQIRELGTPWRAEETGYRSQTGPGDPRIRITGTVKDLRPFLQKATLAVAPIQYGAGIQNKVLEALSCGTPVVTTPKAMEGITARAGEELLVAAPGAPLAEAVISLLQDTEKQRRLRRAGRDFVERNHNWVSTTTRLAAIYEAARSEITRHSYALQ